MDYKVGDRVWVKLRGFPHWPARIDKIDKNKYKLFYFGTHEIGTQTKSSLFPFTPFRDKYALFRGSCPTVLLEGVLEAEVNPEAKPDDTLSNLKTDGQIWMVMGKEGREDFRRRFPDRAAEADSHAQEYNKEVKLARIKAGKDPEVSSSESESDSDSDSSDSSSDGDSQTDGETGDAIKTEKASVAQEIHVEKDVIQDKANVDVNKENTIVEINSRKRVNSETIKINSSDTACSESPKRKKRRTQSESIVADLQKQICKPTTSRARENALLELTNCLRYSLRKSELNADAANQILMDIDSFELSPKDENIEILRTSLELICRLDKLPEIQSQCSSLLSKLKTNTS